MIWNERLSRSLPYAMIAAAALATTWNLFRAAGMPYNVDISGFFPLTPEAYEARFWPLWNERGGMSAAQFLPALLLELPFLFVGHSLGWGMDLHIKVRILFGFALAGVAMYALARYHLDRHYSEKLGLWTRALLPLVAALFYMLNPWSVHRVFHYFLWLGYGFAPLVLLMFLRLADKPSWRRAVALAVVAALGTTDPHNPPLFALVVAPFALLHLAGLARRPREAWTETLGLARGLAIALAAYVGICAFWIFPYVYAALTDPGFGPTYVLSDEMLGVLSRNAGFWDVLRLTHNYQPRAPLAPIGGAPLEAWNFASLAVPVLALLGLLLARRSAAVGYAVLGAAAIVLGLGSAGSTGGLYHWLLFDAPWGEGLSWLFRDPYRWGGIQALAYGALLAFALAELAVLAGRVPSRMRGSVRAAGPSVALACIALFVAPSVTGYMGAVYAPLEIPAEFAEANAHLATTPEEDGVVWMPRMLGATTWSGDKTLAYFDATSSARAAMGPFRPHTDLYFRFLDDANKDGADVPELLARAGLQRVVFHNDRDPARDASKIYSLEQAGLVLEARVGDGIVRAVDQASMAPANVAAAKYAINGTRALSQSFTPTLRDPIELTLLAKPVGDQPPLVVRIFDEAGKVVATRTVTAKHNVSEVTVSLRGLQFSLEKSYTLQLSAAKNGTDAKARWDVSYYKVDTYPQGNLSVSTNVTNRSTWRPLAGDLAFEFQSQARGFIDVLRSPEEAPRIRASEAAIVSPGSLQTLRILSALPENTTLREAPVVFTAAAADARVALATPGPWHWVAPLGSSPWEAVIPFLPEGTIIAPFASTTSADGTTGWARGTGAFTYYEWGWSSSLAALKQEAWDFDGNQGLVYTSAPANLTIPVHDTAQGTQATVLARVYEHPKGGQLRVHATSPLVDALVGTLDTRAPVAGFRWREVGALPLNASSLRLEGDGAFLGVNLLAVVPPAVLATAQAASQARFERTPVTLVEQAEVAPGVAARIVAVPGVGRFAEINRSVPVRFDTPASATHVVWLRMMRGTPAPIAAIDGRAVGLVTCATECDGPAPWHSVWLGDLAAGAHTLTLAPANATARPTIDVIAITTERAVFAQEAAVPELAWTRVSATEYRVSVGSGGPMALTLATPYDAGWVARVDGSPMIRSVIGDGVGNTFVLPAHDSGLVILSYEPQAWADRGAFVALTSLFALLAGLALPGLARVRIRGNEDARPTSKEE